jgi:hypothetical protein
MTHCSINVVPRVQPLTEDQFRLKWQRALARLCDEHGEAQVALWMGVSIRHLGTNVLRGTSLPSPDKIWNLLAYDASAHDEIDKAFGLKNVLSGAVCTSDPLTLDMIALAHETANHESETSHGGPATTDHELLSKDEGRLRKIHRTLGTWLHRIEALRSPSIRSVA